LILLAEVRPELDQREAYRLEHPIPRGDGVGEILVLVLELGLEGVDAFEPDPSVPRDRRRRPPRL
jgi:hypothetical protein